MFTKSLLTTICMGSSEARWLEIGSRGGEGSGIQLGVAGVY